MAVTTNIHHRIYEEELAGPLQMLTGTVEDVATIVNESDGAIPLPELLDRVTVALDESEVLVQHIRGIVENARGAAV